MSEEIQKLRKEFIEKFGNADLFDDFYFRLCRKYTEEVRLKCLEEEIKSLKELNKLYERKLKEMPDKMVCELRDKIVVHKIAPDLYAQTIIVDKDEEE